MSLTDVLTGMKYWFIAGIVISIIIGDIGDIAPYIAITALIGMTTISLLGVNVKKRDVTKRKKDILMIIACSCFLSTVSILVMGLLFADNIWPGWVLLAASPCAVSTISCTAAAGSDVKLSFIGVIFVYIIALFFMPMLSQTMIGNAVDPMEILKYIILFVVIPLAITLPFRKMKVPAKGRNIGINLCFFIMLVMAMGPNLDTVYEDPMLAAYVAIILAVRTIVVFLGMEYLLRRLHVRRESRQVFVMMAVWKNSTLVLSLAMILIADTAVTMPLAISVMVDTIGLMASIWYYTERCPPEKAPENIPTTV